MRCATQLNTSASKPCSYFATQTTKDDADVPHHVFVKGPYISISTTSLANCSVSIKAAKETLDSLSDKPLDAVVVEGNDQEDSSPVIESLLRAWSRKVKIGGAVIGKDYVVSKPFNQRWKKQAVATPHERATKQAVDQFRTGDDNELGQDDTVRVGGGSLWYFVKIKPTIFGR